MLENFISPQNCLAMDALMLNSEIQTTLQDSLMKLDTRIKDEQTKLTACFAGVLDFMT